MKKGGIILNIILLVAVAILFFLYVDSNKQFAGELEKVKVFMDEQEADAIDSTTLASISPYDGAVVFFNRDSLFKNCKKVQGLVKQLEHKEKSLSMQYEKKVQAFQTEYMNAEKKAQNEPLTQAELAELQYELQQKQQLLLNEERALQEDLLKFQNELNEKLYQMVYGYIQKINKDKNFDYVLTYSKEMPLLYPFNEELDITNLIINGLDNE